MEILKLEGLMQIGMLFIVYYIFIKKKDSSIIRNIINSKDLNSLNYLSSHGNYMVVINYRIML